MGQPSGATACDPSGAGTVGQTVGAALAGLGHTVTLGTRRPEATGDERGRAGSLAGWLREWFGWRHILDLGGLSAARGTEAYLLLWVRAMPALDTAMFNVKVVR